MNNRQIWENIFQVSQAVFRVTHLFPKDEILRRHLRAKITEILYQSSQNFSYPASHPDHSFCHSERSEESRKYENLTKEIHDFRSFLFTAKNCNFVDEKNIVILIKECENLLEKLDKFSQESFQVIKDQNDVIAIRPPTGGAEKQSQQFYTDSIPSSFPQPAMSLSPRRQSRPLQTPNSKLQTDQSDIGFFVPNIRQQKIIDYFKKNNKEKIRLKNVADEFRNITPRTVRSDLRELCDKGHLIRNGNGAGSYYHLPQ